jgi:hypothetical protein
MLQLTLATAGFDKHSKQIRRAAFLAEMEQVVPWRELCAAVEPFYSKPGNGRPPIALERMLRLHNTGSTCLTQPPRRRWLAQSFSRAAGLVCGATRASLGSNEPGSPN